jgi:HK97 family phage portal protein
MNLFGDTKSISTQDFLRGTDIDDAGRGAVMHTPYAQSAWVYCAVSILAQSVAQIPFRISRVSGGKARQVRALRSSADPAHRKICRRALGEDILESGDVVDLFKHPHPTMDSQMFFEMLVTWLSLRGEFFVLPLDLADQPVDMSERKPRVKRLLTLPPEMFWHVVQGYDLMAWRYTGSPLMSPLSSQYLLPTEVIQSKLPNPYLYWRGLSPLTVALAPAQTDFAGEQYLKGLWLNNADTGVIVTTDQILQDDQRRAIESALRERKRKAGTPDRPLFLFGGAKVEKPTLSMLDMEFIKTREFLRREIFAILKVPETLAGFTADLNDGGAGGSLDAQKASFIESTVGSLCGRIEDAFAEVVASFDPNFVGWFDVDSLPIMQAARRARWDTGTKMFAMGVPVEDINTNLDLGLPDRAWYKKGFLPFNLQDAGAASEPLPSEQAEPAPNDEEAKSNPFARMGKLLANIKSNGPTVRKPGVDVVALWTKHVAARKAQVNLFKSKTGKVLNKFRASALAKLAEVHLQKDFAEVSQKGLVDIIFSHLAFGEALAGELAVPQTTLLQSAGKELLAEVGHDDPWEYPPAGVKEFLAKRKVSILGTGETVRNQINTTLTAGIEAGETHLELAARVKAVFNTMTDGEAKRVAMTEVNIAYETARDQASRDAGIEYKAWLSSHGPHVREAHAAAEEDYIDNPILIDEPFEVGGEQLMYPGDDSLGASLDNIINCQCVRLAAQKTGEDEKSITFKIFGIGEMKFLKK